MAGKHIHKQGLLVWAALSTLGAGEAVLQNLHAAELDKKIPVVAEGTSFPQQFNLPSQPLNQSIRQLSNQTGLSISYDSELTKNKTAPAIKGFISPQEALKKMLQGSGLQLNINGDSAVIKPEPDQSSKDLQLEKVEVRAKRFYEVGPLPGLGLTKEQIPGNVQSLTAKDIKDSHSLSITDLMNKKLQSVTVNDYQGNPFQMDVQYRGFTAGPQIGTPQGLSVFFDGIRVNEPFGDVVNWDMIPMNALAGVDVFPGSNPIFGLNTLGGAFTLKTKDGFNNAGADAEVLTGSFGRKQLQVEGGWNNGTLALFGAGNFFLEDGWRKNSPSRVNQFFGKASYRGEKLDINLSTLWVGTDLVGNGLVPSEIYAQDRNSIYSSPDTTKNRLQQFQLSSSYFVNDNFTVTGQIYRRASDRRQKGADVFTGLSDQEDDPVLARRDLTDTEQYTCLLNSTNDYGIPDYYILTVDNTNDPFMDLLGDAFVGSGITNPNDPQFSGFTNLVKNKELPAEVLASLKEDFRLNSNLNSIYYQQTPSPPVPATGPDFVTMQGQDIFKADGIPDNEVNVFSGLDNYYYTTENGVSKINFIMPVAATNNTLCKATQALNGTTNNTQTPYSYIDPATNAPATVDGALYNQKGIVAGTPTAILTDNQINQVTDGASLQLNWSFEKHKFMVGASIDVASAEYSNKQRLGLLDLDRRAFLAPDLIHPQFAGADVDISNNDFSGTNSTKSIYFSETWMPTDKWNFNASARYNQTRTKNKVATRYGLNTFDIGEILSLPDKLALCPNGDCNGVPTSYKIPNLSDILDPAETEKFSYYSLNPSLGATWQAKESLNVYANWAKGTRTPSVVELGCALDKTPTGTVFTNPDGTKFQLPKSVVENRTCSLPTTLSGDPYLPQIKATTYDIGMRGTIGNSMQWNLGAFQTDLKDDIYFVAVSGTSGFFDTVGKTRRRGIEAGLSGKVDKWGFSLNYGLTDATFEDNFYMFSADNSTARTVNGFGRNIIEVKQGSTMPGVPLHNLNASVSFDVTPKWRLGLSAVMHSESYVRGNENNEHQRGVSRVVPIIIPDPAVPGAYLPSTLTLPPTQNPGKLPGYATFNFQTSYQFNREWSATVLVNNIFDKEFFSAGRLGRNPFSPSINGAIGPGGYNHNSNDWLSTNFIAPSAPRGIWFSLNWHFVPD